MTFCIILGLSAFLIALLGTRLSILAQRKRVLPLDLAYLKTKKAPTARGGGIVLVFTLIIGMLMADGDYGPVISLLLLAAAALLGDLIEIPGFVKLLVQLLSVAVTLGGMPHGLFEPWLAPGPDKCLTALIWLWMIYTFMTTDGIDGLCGSLLIAMGASLVFLMAMNGLFPGPLAEYGLAMAAAAVGFLWWNWPPARIAMGEVGSMPLGFLVGYLLLLLVQAGFVVPALILPAYVISDAGITLLRRLHYGNRLNAAQRAHYYERRARLSSPIAVLRYIAGLHILLASLAVLAALQPDIAALPLALAYFAVFMLLGFFAYERH